jgi:hypothetical protein
MRARQEFIPDRYEHLVRYCGRYSYRSRGARAAKVVAAGTISGGVAEVLSDFAQRAKAAWARLIALGLAGLGFSRRRKSAQA